MPAICREGDDFHIGHASPTPNPFHKTPYVASGNTKVKVEGSLAIITGDTTSCGDTAVGGSSKVTINGKGVHRKNDATSGHGSWSANKAASGSLKVNVG